MERFFKFLLGEQRQDFLEGLSGTRHEIKWPEGPPVDGPGSYEGLGQQVLHRAVWWCQFCDTLSDLELHDEDFTSQGAKTPKKT
jgi:hypothetical protein